MSEITIKPSKDRTAVIIGGRKFPLTENNADAWKQYKVTGDKKELWFKLSKVVIL